MTKFVRKNHRSRDYGTRQRAAACFVNPRDARDAGGSKFFLVTKATAAVHPRKSLADFCE